MPVAFYGGAHDDFLFVSEAASILDGHWLGPFGRLTLSKGPFFPLFLAGGAALHVPPPLAAEAVLLGASWLAADLVARLAGTRGVRTPLFAWLAANPAPLDLITTDLMREPLYAGLLLGVLALGGRLFLCRGGMGNAVAFGLAIAAFWCTRQEGMLLVPPLSLMAAYGIWRDRRAAPLLVAFAAAALPLLAVCAINARAYGVFRIDDMTAGPFSRAYGAMARVGDMPRARYVPVPRAARLLAYRVSPAAATLAPYLEGEGLRYWSAPGCGENPIPDCGEEIQAGWFMWALRDAAVAAGHDRTARETDRFWRTLAGEIERACDAHTIACSARRDALAPPLGRRDLGPILHETWHAAIVALRLGPPTLGTYPTRPFAEAPVYRRVVTAGPVAPSGPAVDRRPPLGGARRVVARVLCRVMPSLAIVLAPLGMFWVAGALALALRRRALPPLTVFGSAVLLAIVCRLAMLGVLSATAIRLQFRYVSPILPLVLLLAALPFAASLGRRSMKGFSTQRQVNSGSTRISSTATAMHTGTPQAPRR